MFPLLFYTRVPGLLSTSARSPARGLVPWLMSHHVSPLDYYHVGHVRGEAIMGLLDSLPNFLLSETLVSRRLGKWKCSRYFDLIVFLSQAHGV